MSAVSPDDPAMPAWPDWRDGEQYRHMVDLDRAGWAWEWLRRNPDYAGEQQDVPAADPVRKRRFDAATPHLAIDEPAPRWGLCFR